MTPTEWLRDNPGSSAAQIAKGIGVMTADLLPDLARLEAAGVLTGAWEAPEPFPDEDRRRVYRMAGTDFGRTAPWPRLP